ncbi:MAG: hypothetical protein HC814_02940 [Rhodobacteraceae bacterium]|nr:hypothetical protein [Paracoccaceae bacterium]
MAQVNPDDLGLRHDLSIALQKIGNIRVAEDSLAEALDAYIVANAIDKALAAADPENAHWTRCLALSNMKVAEVAELCDSVDVARNHYAAALRLVQTLAAQGRLAPLDGWTLEDLRWRIAELGDGDSS